MDDKLRRRPFMHVVDRVVLFEQLLRFLIPRTATPFMVELYSWLLDNKNRARDVVTHKEKLVGGVAIVGRVEYPIVAHERLEIKPVLGVTLDPAMP